MLTTSLALVLSASPLAGLRPLPAPLHPMTLSAAPGQSLRLSVVFPAAGSGLLLNREAPNRLTLSTPWGKATAQPSGTRHPSAEFAGYFASVRPSDLRLPLPATVRPGNYMAFVSAELFLCDTHDKICTRREFRWPLTVRVGATSQPGLLRLRASDLAGSSLRR